MQTADIRVVMLRDLRALGREVAAYPDDASLWHQIPGITNSGGTLALHLAGNVRHFVGAVLGGSGFVRDRDAEFTRRDVSRAELAALIEAAIAEVDQALTPLTDAELAAPYPLEIGGNRYTTARWLTHLVSHLAYHLGQMDYHRRIVAPQSGTAQTMGLGEL
jgi:uncharacterized damage-inducible protein DinB